MDLSDLYRDVIRDHSKSPRNFRAIPETEHHAEGHNPLCGDRVTVYLTIDDGVIADASFEGQACALCTASTSMLTTRIKGKRVEELEAMGAAFVDALVKPEEPDWEDSVIEDLAALGGVRKYPMRVKCVTLPWHTLKAAIIGNQEVSSE